MKHFHWYGWKAGDRVVFTRGDLKGREGTLRTMGVLGGGGPGKTRQTLLFGPVAATRAVSVEVDGVRRLVLTNRLRRVS